MMADSHVEPSFPPTPPQIQRQHLPVDLGNKENEQTLLVAQAPTEIGPVPAVPGPSNVALNAMLGQMQTTISQPPGTVRQRSQ